MEREEKPPSPETLSGIPQYFREFRHVEVAALRLQLQHIALGNVMKITFPPRLINHHGLKKDGCVKVEIHALLSLALESISDHLHAPAPNLIEIHH